MKPRGSRYAQKHNINQSSAPKKTLENRIEEDNEALLDILYAPYQFMERFDKLPYEQQIGMIMALHAVVKEQRQNPRTGDVADFAESAQQCLDKIHERMNTSLDEGNYAPLADDEKRLIRMDCYGKINKRAPHQLSPLYLYFISPENRQHARLSDYHLDSSPGWRVFNQFESFRRISARVKYFLYKREINPDALKVMTVNDFCDVIYNAFKTGDSADAASFTPKEKSVRVTQIRNFMKHCGNEFEQQLLRHGYDERLVRSLCNALRRFGHCDIKTLNVTETHYTAQIIENLGKAGFDVSGIAEGDIIPQVFVNELIDEHREALIIARDKNGGFLDKRKLPNLEVHHKHAVQFSANNGYLARANYPNNLLLVEALIHSRYFHLFDRVIKDNQMNNMYSRLNINKRIMASVIGFSPEDAIYFDFEQSAAFKRRETMDKKCVVNYLKMMEERAQNELELIDKYQISYSRNSFQRSFRFILENMKKPNKDSENMKKFKIYMAELRKKRRE